MDRRYVKLQAPSGESPKHQASSAKPGGGRAEIKKLQAREACDKLSHDNMSFSIYPAPTPATCQVYHIL